MRTTPHNSPAGRRRWRRTAAVVTATAALLLTGLTTAAHADTAPASTSRVTWTRSCALPRHKDEMACNALRVTGGRTAFQQQHGISPTAAEATSPSGYGPSDLQDAYGLTSAAATNGTGRTVAIVDAYDDPDAESDLAAYRSHYGLPACTTAGGCFKKVSQTGSTTALPTADSGWSGEISLDLDMASAICPNCHILLVEAKSASMANLGTAVNEAVGLGATYVSNSYGGGESSSDATYDSAYFNHPGVAITVSAGDAGYGAEYPAASKYVTAVGGTRLTTSSTTRGWTESVWRTSSTEGTGSGCSAYDAKPAWQTDTGCAKRMIADVSAVADPATGVSVYDTYGADGQGWATYGGTSASAPIIASVYALAGTPSGGSYPAKFPYANTAALNDVTSGTNGTCATSYFCTARTGYDGPTGWGTPNGVGAFTG
ncbi:putative Pseudomonalisin [Streptomyces afghaniensis 772]|uniref:Putative Pseudomonalisin n=1 Tax=Streptomyces afghaniensis 772 TaxID=1283301 RepID=S4MR66_9ACTN|nr:MULTISPECIES: S53 family peptidase [Streptomyces]EPJ42038.1 putative Pseudomonalisin [Streptomyces afghaniensis 772]UOB11916.1 S53 family peptidase [Streptomyces sp. HP-A2021]